jgi:hypothetical protein
MDYELRIVVEKVASSSQQVVKRDTITSYALQLSLSRLNHRLPRGQTNPEITHSTELCGKVCHHSSKASRGEDLQVEHPV